MLSATMKKGHRMRWVLAIGLAIVSVWLVWSAVRMPHGAEAKSMLNAQALQPGASFLFRFDPTTQIFLTVPLPSGSIPIGVAVTGTSPAHVWATEYGTNRIGHLIFTDTAHYQLSEYAITSTMNSGPYRIAVAGNDVWFTERGANRVGRLNAVTGQVDEFYVGLQSNAGLADIQIAPDGAVWLTAQQSNQIVRLTVDSPITYTFQPFTNSLLIGPFGLAIENADSIWFTAPAGRRIGRLIPSTPFGGTFNWPQIPPSDFKEPYDLVFHNRDVWLTDRAYNRIGQIFIDTWTSGDYYGPLSHPAGIAVRDLNVFWVTQQSNPGALARFVVTPEVTYTLNSFPLPMGDLLPTGIDIAADNMVWLAGYKPYQVYLPIMRKNSL